MIHIKSLFAGTSIAVLAILTLLAFPATAQAAASTLDNMQAAFNGESNAHARYLAFAKKADTEGYGQVASMFRAAARAEEIHASNHAAVIKTMGAVPQAKIDAPEVKSTRENLQAAIKGETYERDVMYPEFLQKARLDRNRDAIKSLNYAKTAEAEHAKLYAEALNSLDQLKGSRNEAFYVCPNCGFTARTLPQEKCPSCFTPKEKFEKVA
jgi:rubrerythrin